ncbi:MAG: ADP-glyceromanno-heptose 6-epimerase [Bacteroidetes bacterium]|nr:ADP-glyceromanno-heptose 6-epimerase [Bacteroidota bacterium]
MIVVTGAAGFIGSCLISKILDENLGEVIAVDDFSDKNKLKNLEGKKIKAFADLHNFIKNPLIYGCPKFVFHIGAITDTAEFDVKLLKEQNTEYSKKLWNFCSSNQIPFIYASSAATYGMGEIGFDDNQKLLPNLKPMNPYGQSKQDFDIWAIEQNEKPPFWAGFKFFNVFGPNEYHKGRMASVVYHGTKQIIETGKIRLFKSYKPEYNDGEQKRDFIYIKDVLNVLIFMFKKQTVSSIYNLGTGKAHSWNELAKAIFKALNIAENIEYIDMPADIKEKYQYYTEANMQKLNQAGYNLPFTPFDEAINDYVNNYLKQGKYY